MAIKHLSFVPFPLEDESPTSLIQRAAKANGCTTCYELFRFLKTATLESNYSNTLLENSAFSRALQMCAPNVQKKIALGFYTPIHPLMKQSDVMIHGLRVLHRNLRCLTSAFCSECATEGFERYPKDLTLFVNCPYHARGYLTCCPSCLKQIKWQTCLSNRCTCGHLLVSPAPPKSEIAPDNYLLTLFKDGKAEALGMIQRVLSTLERTTYTDIENIKTQRRNLAIAITNKDISAMTDAIHGCLPCQTVDEIDISLIIFRSYLDTRTYESLRKKLISSVNGRHHSVAEVFIPIRTLIKYLGTSQTAWYRSNYSSTFFGKKRNRMRCTPGTALAIKQALHAESIANNPLHVNTGKRDHYAYIFSIATVSECTGLPPEVIKQLSTKSNLLGYHRRTHEKARPLTFGRYWIEKFNRIYTSNHQLSEELHLPLNKINNAIIKLGIDIKVGKLADCTLITKNTYKERIANYITSPSIKKPRKKRTSLKRPSSSTADHPDLLNSDQCAELLSLPKREVLTLVREGLLPFHALGSRKSYLITSQSVLDFGDSIFRHRELSRLLGIKSTKLLSHLKNHGVYPVSGRSVGSGTMNLFKKSDLTRAHLIPLTQETKIASEGHSKNFDRATSELCKIYNLSTGQFTTAFLKTKFATYKSYKSAHYITSESYKSIAEILELYVPLKDADAILNVPQGYTRQLLHNGRLPIGTPHSKHFPGLIEKSRISQYLAEKSLRP